MFPTLVTRAHALVGLLALLVGPTNAEHPDFTTRPHVFPGLQFLGSNLIKNPERNARVYTWRPSYLPELCIDEASSRNHSLSDMEAFSISYDDCREPWVFCRHKKSQTSRKAMVLQFGSLPVGMRDYVRHVVSFPSPDDGGASAYALTGTGDIVMVGDTSGNKAITVWAHETGHCIDMHSGPKPMGDFSGTKPWLDAFDADLGVPDQYSKATQAENFAQHVVVALYDKANDAKGGIFATPGGCKVYQFRHQLNTVLDHLGSQLEQTGRCKRGKVETTSPIIDIRKMAPVGGSTKKHENRRRGIAGKQGVLSLANVPTTDTEFVEIDGAHEDEEESSADHEIECLGVH